VPRVTKEQAGRNRSAITEASARLFRERGLKGVSVADLMAAAGLTHGGFYRHFDSKDAVAAEACAAAFERSARRWRKRLCAGARRGAAKAALVEGYLSGRSRARPGTSCPAAALAADVAREAHDAPIRATYAAGVAGLLEILATAQPSGDAAADRHAAAADFAVMVGAMVLARATAGHPLSDEFLRAARERLGAPPARSAPQRMEP